MNVLMLLSLAFPIMNYYVSMVVRSVRSDHTIRSDQISQSVSWYRISPHWTAYVPLISSPELYYAPSARHARSQPPKEGSEGGEDEALASVAGGVGLKIQVGPK